MLTNPSITYDDGNLKTALVTPEAVAAIRIANLSLPIAIIVALVAFVSSTLLPL